ncbi:DUF4245 domain-containing protein [Tessaracoccus sp. Z1128]
MARRNPNARTRDMVISMAVLLVPIALIAWWFTVTPEPRPEAVSVEETLARAVAESPYPPLRAAEPGADWIPVRVAWAKEGDPWITGDPATGNWWQVGYLAPDEIYYGVQQRDGAPAGFVADTTREGRPLGDDVDLAGRTWERYESADGRTRSLVHADDVVTSIVTADADFTALEAFAATLVEAR